MNAARNLFIKVLSEAAESTKPKGYMGLLTDNSITLKNLLLSAVVVCLELLLSAEVFDCPMRNHTLYGTVFLLAPIVIIFVINVIVLSEVWKLTDRCCVPRYRRKGECCYRVCPNVVKALVGPAVWLIASFADSTYYVCAVMGPDIEKRNLTNATEIKEVEAEFAHAKSKSHLWAWLVFVVVVIVTAAVMATKKCCLKDNVLLEDDYILERREAVAALLTFRHFIEHPHEHGDHLNEEEGGPRTEAEAGSLDDEARDGKDNAEKVKLITGRFMGKEEEITLYPDGIPEQCGKKRVEKFFDGWSKTGWRYEDAYEKFQCWYPRVTSGRPKDEWIAKGDDDNECSTLIGCAGH